MTRRQLIGLIVVLIIILALAAIFVPEPRLRGPIVGGLIGVVASAVTLLGQYYLRRSDPLWWQISEAWSSSKDGVISSQRTFMVRIINTREVGTALWNVRVVFYKNDQEPFAVTPTLSQGEKSLIEVIDLPSQQTVTLHLRVEFRTNDVASIEKVKNADKVKLLADIPGESPFEEDLPAW